MGNDCGWKVETVVLLCCRLWLLSGGLRDPGDRACKLCCAVVVAFAFAAFEHFLTVFGEVGRRGATPEAYAVLLNVGFTLIYGLGYQNSTFGEGMRFAVNGANLRWVIAVRCFVCIIYSCGSDVSLVNVYGGSWIILSLGRLLILGRTINIA